MTKYKNAQIKIGIHIAQQYHREKLWACICVASLSILLGFSFGGVAQARTEVKYTEASWYSVKSCHKEGTSGIMANGRLLDDSKKTCASWEYPFGTKLLIKFGDRQVISEVTDRGPNKTLYRKGRRLDLSKASMLALGGIKQGIIKVSYEVVQ